MKTKEWEKTREFFKDFIRTYDEAAEEAKQLKKLKLIDMILTVFIIIVICMFSVQP